VTVPSTINNIFHAKAYTFLTPPHISPLQVVALVEVNAYWNCGL